MIIVQGGTLGTNTKEALEAHLSAKTNKHRAAVVEAVSTSGSLDSAGAVQVRVERFGSERQQDAMFQKYDLACEDHVRVSFRLPPLFLGKASDYNFATAYTAYMIAEAQVFAPERTEFDNYLNETIVTALGVKSYRYRSLPMTLTDVANQLKAIEIVTSKFVSGEEVVKKLNEVTGLSMQYEKQAQPINLGLTPGVMPQQQSGATATIEPPTPESTARQNQPKASNVGKQEISGHLIELAERFSAMLEGGVTVFGQGEQTAIKEEVAGLSPAEYDTFATLLANNSIEMIWTDQSGLEELCACAGHLVTP